MARKRKKAVRHSQKAGKAPGTLIYTGTETGEPVELSLIKYNKESHEALKCADLDKAIASMEPNKVNWLNVSALEDVKLIEQIGKHFGLHALVLEDILNVDQMPKMQDFGTYDFVTLKMISVDAEGDTDQESVSFILGDHFLISFQEKKGDIFEPVRQRIETGLGRARGKGADYLLFALMDIVVDNYYFVIESLNDELTKLEAMLADEDEPRMIYRINEDKQKLFMLRKAVSPLRETLRKLSAGESKLIKPDIGKYFNDVLDHVNHINQDMEIQRDMLNGYVDIYNANVSNRMNNVMKTLTIIATIFIPLTFIAGIYGMNFNNMPELQWEYGYPTALGVMFFGGVAMYVYMKRRDWL